MGNCSCAQKNSKTRIKITLAILGLDNAGKTVTAKGLKGEPTDDVTPTVGFTKVDFEFKDNGLVYYIEMYDLGGGRTIRDIWKNYLAEIYGLVYVVDSTDVDRMEECREVFERLLTNEKIQGKPVLLLANKQNLDGALDELDICEHLQLEQLVNTYKTPCRVETCDSNFGTGKNLDKPIQQGMKWLLGMVTKEWATLHERVSKDVKEKKEQEEREKKERLERVRRIREERDKKEQAERLARGEPLEDAKDKDEEIHGDPFKRVDVKELEERDRQHKEQRRLAKEKDKSAADTPKAATMNGHSLPPPLLQPLPSLVSPRQSKSKTREHGDSPGPQGDGPSSLPDQRRPMPHLPSKMDDGTGERATILPPINTMESLESLASKQRKKKRRRRKNQTSPRDEVNSIDSADSFRLGTPRASQNPHLITVKET